MKILSRRTVLRGLGGAAIPLPFLDIMARSTVARAAPPISKTGLGGRPKRFVILLSPCGQGQDWFKNTNGADGKMTLSTSLKPLERHKDSLLFFNGIDNKSAMGDGANLDPGHGKPFVNLFTSTPSKNGKGGGISIDQAIANEVAGDTKFPSLQLSFQNVSFPPLGFVSSWKSAGVPLLPLTDPQRVFTKLFSDLNTDPAVFAKIQAERKSMLDGIREDYVELAGRLGADDRTKLNVHLEALRDVEKNINSSATPTGGGAGACSAPAMPGKAGFGIPDYLANSAAELDMLAIALACDLTRVGTLMFQGAGGNPKLPGFTQALHDASHDFSDGGNTTRNKYTAWFANYYADFFDKLKGLKEAGGISVYDNTVLLWATEHGDGNHNYDRIPLAVAGGTGGYFRMGRQVNVAGRAGQGELYTSLLNAMGIPAKTFGLASLCRGPLPDLV